MSELCIDITSEDIAFYRTHGWWVSPPLLTDKTLDDLSYAIARYAANECDRVLSSPIVPKWTGALNRGVRQADYLSLQIDAVMDFVCAPPLPQIASVLCGSAEVRLFHDQLVWKDPSGPNGCSSVGWHTDRAYWRSCTSEQMITAWIPLQNTTEEMGTLAVWEGSHLWPNTDDLHTFDEPNLGRSESLARTRYQDPKILILPLQRGQVSFHHCRLVHGSYPNRTAQPRLAFAIHYQDGGNRHVGCSNSGRSAVHLNDILCRAGADGVPDYTDPDVCPLLYSISKQAPE